MIDQTIGNCLESTGVAKTIAQYRRGEAIFKINSSLLSVVLHD
jgi:hypothetical protein